MRSCTRATSPSFAPSVARATAQRRASKPTCWATVGCVHSPALSAPRPTVPGETSESTRLYTQVPGPLLATSVARPLPAGPPCGCIARHTRCRRPLPLARAQCAGGPWPTRAPCGTTCGSTRGRSPSCAHTAAGRSASGAACAGTCGCTQGSALTAAHTVLTPSPSCLNCGATSSPTPGRPTCAPCVGRPSGIPTHCARTSACTQARGPSRAPSAAVLTRWRPS